MKQYKKVYGKTNALYYKKTCNKSLKEFSHVITR